MKRVSVLAAAIKSTIRILPVAGEPGYPPPSEIAAGLADIIRSRLGPIERLTFASAAVMALDRDARQGLIEAAGRGRQAEEQPVSGVEPEMWRRVCREHRRPALTPKQKRQAAVISFDDSPRETLARAWAGATDRDRRDIVEKATGGACA